MASSTAIEEGTNTPALPSPAECRRTRLEAELQRFLAIVTEQMDPERIILFGSLANGQVHEWSDLDLVVITETELPFFERLRRVFNWIAPTVGMDVLVYTPAEWEHLRVARLFVREEIAEKGRVIYERVR